jgi:hypothetical protein
MIFCLSGWITTDNRGSLVIIFLLDVQYYLVFGWFKDVDALDGGVELGTASEDD